VQYSLNGRLWLSQNDKSFLGNGRIELLEQIDATGSISKASKNMKMSYKAAWDAIEVMNTLSQEPLIQRVSGGKGGGGSVITPYGKELIQTYKVLHSELKIFLNNLSMKVNDADGRLNLLHTMSMRVSARNQIIGEVVYIEDFNLHKKITLYIQGGDTITTIITTKSTNKLSLKKGMLVYALFKASSLKIHLDDTYESCEENLFIGLVEHIEAEEAQNEITILLNSGNRLYTLVSDEQMATWGLSKGQKILVSCHFEDIILGLF